MNFIREAVSKKEMLSILETWQRKFGKKKLSPLTTNAASIASQMVDSCRERHGYLYIAREEESFTPSAFLIADDSKSDLIIRFVLADVCNTNAKGSGRFLVQEMVNFAEARGLSIRATSQNADAFWKKCPGFKLDPENPTDFIFKPGVALVRDNSNSFFESADTSKKKKKARDTESSLSKRGR